MEGRATLIHSGQPSCQNKSWPFCGSKISRNVPKNSTRKLLQFCAQDGPFFWNTQKPVKNKLPSALQWGLSSVCFFCCFLQKLTPVSLHLTPRGDTINDFCTNTQGGQSCTQGTPVIGNKIVKKSGGTSLVKGGKTRPCIGRKCSSV
jgi:hypothetical protein